MKPLVIMFVVAGVMAALSLIFLFVLLALAGITIAVLIYGLICAIRQARQRPTPDWLVSRRQVVATLPPGIREDFTTKEWPEGWTTNRAIAEGLIP